MRRHPPSGKSLDRLPPTGAAEADLTQKWLNTRPLLSGLSKGADGSIYILTDTQVIRHGTDGSTVVMAGGGSPADGYGDNNAATAAKIHRVPRIPCRADKARLFAPSSAISKGG